MVCDWILSHPLEDLDKVILFHPICLSYMHGEVISLYINQKVEENIWHLISIFRRAPISLLLFADDVLLFCRAKNSQVKMVLEVMNGFCNASGLRINFDKSRAMCSKVVSRHQKENFTSISSIHFTTNLCKYLGVLLIQGNVTKATFYAVLEKIHHRLAT